MALEGKARIACRLQREAEEEIPFLRNEDPRRESAANAQNTAPSALSAFKGSLEASLRFVVFSLLACRCVGCQ